MLVLSRKCNESIILNAGTENEITVQVLQVVGKRVRLGFTAPSTVEITRSELIQEAVPVGHAS
jgi:carbon storage regulator CsrA